MPYKDFNPGELFTAADADLLMRQGLIVVTDAAERDAIFNPTEGMRVYRLDTKRIETRVGSSWLSEVQPYRQYVGSVVISGSGTPVGTAAFVFPADRFQVPPAVFPDQQVNSTGSTLIAAAINVTKDGGTMRLSAGGANFSSTYTVRFRAVQMTPTSAEG